MISQRGSILAMSSTSRGSYASSASLRRRKTGSPLSRGKSSHHGAPPPPAAAPPASSLAAEQVRNESARIRCVALCVETRPDWAGQSQIDQMLSLGTTRVELGVQSLTDDVLKRVSRGHTVQDSADATALLKDSFLKVGYHLMPGLPGSTPDLDREMFRSLFSDPCFRPDALKIYPCFVMEGTPLAEDFRKSAYEPLSTQEAV